MAATSRLLTSLCAQTKGHGDLDFQTRNNNHRHQLLCPVADCDQW